MKNLLNRCAKASFGLVAVTITTAAFAQDDTSSPFDGPLYDGTYIAPMASGVFPGSNEGLKDTVGGLLGIGYRRDWWAMEMRGDYYSVPAKAGGSVDQYGGGLYGLIFPFSASSSALPHNLYGLLGIGLLQNDGFPASFPRSNGAPGPVKPQNFLTTTYSAGIGDMLPMQIGRYEFAIRAEAVYRYGNRSTTVNSRFGDSFAPNDFKDVLVNLGLQLPLGLKPIPVAAPAEPVNVVPVLPPADTDGDGVTDDKDQCPNTAAGTQVNDVGCPLPPPCKPPEAGQKVDLSGCAVGDSIVLRGVNFEYDKSKLTLNAQTLLDGVVDALNAAPNITVEVDGHTDSRGSDDYNQKLSEDRAESVMHYLSEHGVAAERMSAVGLGETQPIADNDTDEGRELNRRVELKIVDVGAPNTVVTPMATTDDNTQSLDDTPLSADPATTDSTPAAGDAGDVGTMPDNTGPSSALAPASVPSDDMSAEPQQGQ